MQFFHSLSQLPQLLFFRLYSLLVSLLLLPKLFLKNKITVNCVSQNNSDIFYRQYIISS